MKHNGEHQQNGGRDPNAILKEIERTREEMDSTLTAIEHRLTPGQLVDQGIDYLRKSGANEFVQNLAGQVKHHPLPVTLVGIGIAWLMATGRQQQSAGSSSSKLSEGTQAVRERMSQAGSSISDLGQSARQRFGDLTDSARYQVERAKDSIDYMMREQPLALGAIGVAIGAVIAAMAPRTRKEDELMGDTRDQLIDQAKEVANAAVGTVKKEASKPTVGVHHSFSDAPAQTVPPTPQPELPAPKFGPKAATTAKPPRNPAA
jgi:ElaB/YqjD/DUF883 family membrane-anchored ribosome-binding protein